MNSEHCIDVCNKLLRGERSAVETYDKAIDKHGEHGAIRSLKGIRNEHTEAVAILEENVRSMGGSPDMTSGAWGSFATTIQSAANLFGPESAIEALIRGEKHGQDTYEDAIYDDDVMTECKTLFRSKLLPKVKQHITTLEQLEDTL